MQGVNTTPSQSGSISLPSVRKKERPFTTLGKDFLSVMGDIEKSHVLSLSVNEEHSFTSQNCPIGIYQSMTEEIIPSGTFFKPGSKSLWDDQQFASSVSKGENIDTTKSINWESIGEEKLTQNQIAQLKKI